MAFDTVIFTKNSLDDVHIPIIFRGSIKIGILLLISRALFIQGYRLQIKMITDKVAPNEMIVNEDNTDSEKLLAKKDDE